MKFSGDLNQIKIGDSLKIEISVHQENEIKVLPRTAIVVICESVNHILLSLDEGFELTHNLIWLRSEYAKEALKLGLSEEKNSNTSWWLDSSTRILEINNREEPCIICKRKNFFNEKKCWWCGNSPR